MSHTKRERSRPRRSRWSPPDREIEEAVWHYALTGRDGGSASRLRTDDSGWDDEDPDDSDIFDIDD